MLHHDRAFTESLSADRRAVAARRRPPADAAELERVVSAAAAGNGAAWTALVGRFAARLRAVARAHRLPEHDAEDVVQTTWLRLIEHVEDVRDARAVGAWLETTARRESLRRIAAKQRESPTEAEAIELEPAEPTGVSRLIADERRAAVSAAVERLPRRHQDLLALLASETEPSYPEIARALEMPVGSIGPTRGRALERLRADPELAGFAGEHVR